MSVGKRFFASSSGIQKQGHLDALCGMYACVNALTLMLDGKVDCTELFAAMLNKIDLPTVAGGISITKQTSLLRACATYLRSQGTKLSFQTVDTDRLTPYWQTIQAHCEKHGPGSLILMIFGRHQHWTCIRRVTERRLVLADSQEWHWLDRRHATIGEPNRQRIHQLDPEGTFLLSIQ